MVYRRFLPQVPKKNQAPNVGGWGWYEFKDLLMGSSAGGA